MMPSNVFRLQLAAAFADRRRIILAAMVEPQELSSGSGGETRTPNKRINSPARRPSDRGKPLVCGR